MERKLDTLGEGEFDLAIIGGGAFGAAAAWNAAARGLRTVLIERNDFGGGASAECFKMVHGGIRYLQHMNVSRLRASCRERSALLRIAPHLVKPLPIVIPTYGRGRKGKMVLGAGMRLYDALTLGRNAGIADPQRRIQSSRFLARSELLEVFPDLEAPGLTGGAVFEDGQMYSPPRLVLAFLKSAVHAGLVACNYVEATGFMWQGNRVCGVQARDRIGGGKLDIRARLVLNAAGPGSEYLLEGDARFGQWKRGNFSRDACFIVRREPRSQYALAVPGLTRDLNAVISRSARHMFLVPWRQFTLVGVWHRLFAQHPDMAQVEEAELEAWIREMNACLPALRLTRDDVVYANCGLVPFGAGTRGEQELSFGKESRFIDHAKTHGVPGLVSLIGIRFTTARADAGHALELLLRQMPNAPPAPDTERTPLIGGDIADFEALRSQAQRHRPANVPADALDALLRNHGTEHRAVLELASSDPADSRIVPGSKTLAAEITYAVRTEMAVRLEDVVMRRTDLASACHPGRAALEFVAARMQTLLGWRDDLKHSELQATEAALGRHHTQSPSTTPAPQEMYS
jgi:glycerol-3-phosphate dehydrogenase